MERWEIRPTPTSEDSDRHLLLMRGGPTDVAALLRKFGALFGRPVPYQGEGFNLSLVLHKLKPGTRQKLEGWLRAVAPNGAPAAPAASAAAALEVEPAKPPETPEPETAKPAEPEPAKAAPEPSAGVPGVPGLPEFPTSKPREPGKPLMEPDMPNIPVLKPNPALEPPPNLIPLSPETPAPKAAEPAPAPKAAEPAPAPKAAEPTPAPKAELKPEPAIAPAAPAPAAAAPAPGGFPTMTAGAFAATAISPGMTLREDWNFETLLVGAYNRFAHAAAMSVVGSPGSMYNPLFLYGSPGTGKSHLLHSIASALSKGLGGAGLLATSGPRLSRAVNAALARKSAAELDKLIADSKALLVDDIHLMSVSEANKDALAKIFKSFFDRQLQVVITSLYPPRALGALEEALKFSFSKGWSVDLKLPSPAVQKDLINSAADRAGAEFEGADVSALHEKLSQWGYSDLSLWLRRLTVLKRARVAAGQTATVAEMLPLIYDPIMSGTSEPPKGTIPQFKPPAVPADAASLGVLAPKGQETLAHFAAAQLYEAGAKIGINQPFKHSLWDVYDSAQPFGVPFLIGEACSRAGVKGLLLVGPAADSPLGPRSAEFSHAVRRILDSFDMQLGWIPQAGMQLPAYYLNARLDLAPLPKKP